MGSGTSSSSSSRVSTQSVVDVMNERSFFEEDEARLGRVEVMCSCDAIMRVKRSYISTPGYFTLNEQKINYEKV